jgi:glycosyltransferase involved in cell wall biosynthesis
MQSRGDTMTISAETGIAILTYNRPDHLRQCLNSVLESIKDHPHTHVAVVDDCSDYDIDDVVENRCTVKRSRFNQGVVWAKNRALYYFTKTFKARNIILVEDDMIVASEKWLPAWEEACKIHGHINYSAPWFFSKKLKQHFRGGAGTAKDPHQFSIVTGQCSAVRRSLIKRKVGYLNPSFKGYGYAHVEWTDRLIFLGHGGCIAPGRKFYYSINEGISPLPSESHKDPQEMSGNKQTLKALASDPANQFIHRPWRNRLERRVFLNEDRSSPLS